MKRAETKILILLLVPLLFFFLTMSPTIADDLSITGNGSGSENSISVDNESSTVVDQSNNADINNDVDASANTGGNSVEGNTGGSVNVNTGDATTNVSITNQANVNQAQVGCCSPTPSVPTATPTGPAGGPTSTPTPTGVTTTSTPTPTGAALGVSAEATPTPMGAVAGAEAVAGVAAEVLPVSGSNSTLALMLASIIIFFGGLYLKVQATRPLIKLLKI